MTVTIMTEIAVAAVAAVACATDIRWRRIPNWLTFSGVAAGSALHAVMGGLAGARLSFEGMLLGFGAYLLLYCLRAMGAGDVKLMAAVGAIVGPAGWVGIFVATSLAGGVLALLAILFKGRLRQTFWNIFFILNELAHFRAPYQRREDLSVKDGRSLKMPHGVAVAAGTAAVLLMARI